MAKTKTGLTFNVGTEAKPQLVEEAGYISALTSYAGKKYKSLKLESAQVKKLVQLAVKGEELADEVPDELKELFKKVEADVEAAKDAAAEAAAEEDRKLKEEEEKEAAAKSVELELVEYGKSSPVAMSNFSEKFDLGEGMSQCVPKGEVTLQDWVGAFAFGVALESGSQWIIGDSVVALENAGQENVVIQLSAQLNKAYPTVSGYARAARAFPPDSRKPGLPFTTYREIGNAKFSDDPKKDQKAKEKLLDKAVKEKLSTPEVRSHVRMEQGKETTPQPSFKFLDLNLANPTNSEVLTEAPEKVADKHLLIDLGKKSFLVEGKDAEGNPSFEWVEFAKGK
jgi:hypothetical protein